MSEDMFVCKEINPKTQKPCGASMPNLPGIIRAHMRKVHGIDPGGAKVGETQADPVIVEKLGSKEVDAETEIAERAESMLRKEAPEIAALNAPSNDLSRWESIARKAGEIRTDEGFYWGEDRQHMQNLMAGYRPVKISGIQPLVGDVRLYKRHASITKSMTDAASRESKGRIGEAKAEAQESAKQTKATKEGKTLADLG